jgi:hypothetical protein
MAQALSLYVARRERFSPQRRQELARTLAEPLAARLRLPPDTNSDLLLCALYFRTFIADRGTSDGLGAAPPPPVEAVSA